MEELKHYQIQHNLNIKIDNIKPKYICKLCKNIMVNPKISKCLCRFCENCISDFMNNSSNHNCPSCIQNGRNVELELSNDVETKQKINKLILDCLNNNCNIQCSVETIVDHLLNCDKSEVPCVLNEYGCNVTNITRENMGNHLLENNENHLKLVKKYIETIKNDTILRETEIQDSIEMIKNDRIIRDAEIQASIETVNSNAGQRITEIQDSIDLVKHNTIIREAEIQASIEMVNSNTGQRITEIQDFIKLLKDETAQRDKEIQDSIKLVKKETAQRETEVEGSVKNLKIENKELKLKNISLEEELKLLRSNLNEMKTIVSDLEKRGVMQIFAKTSDGKTVAFEITKYETIVEIKKKIQDKIGLHPEEQNLVFQGGILEDDKTAEECQITKKSTIEVLKRLPIQRDREFY